MDKKLIKKLKNKLMQMKEDIGGDLEKFADKDAHVRGDYEARFPEYGRGRDEDAQEVAGYEARLSMEHEMEVDLLKIDKALEKIEKGNYGECEKCGEEIKKERLQVYPEAELCMQCLKEERD